MNGKEEEKHLLYILGIYISNFKADHSVINTRLAAVGALAHCLQRLTACNTSPPT